MNCTVQISRNKPSKGMVCVCVCARLCVLGSLASSCPLRVLCVSLASPSLVLPCVSPACPLRLHPCVSLACPLRVPCVSLACPLRVLRDLVSLRVPRVSLRVLRYSLDYASVP